MAPLLVLVLFSRRRPAELLAQERAVLLQERLGSNLPFHIGTWVPAVAVITYQLLVSLWGGMT